MKTNHMRFMETNGKPHEQSILELLENQRRIILTEVDSYEKTLSAMIKENQQITARLKRLKLEVVVATCANEYGIPVSMVMGKNKREHASTAKQLATWICWTMATNRESVIEFFGRKRTVLEHRVRTINKKRQWPSERQRFDSVMEKLGLPLITK